jgi:DNA-binding NarL/FixJ family response regulator
VLVCDDAPDVRALFAIELQADGDIDVVGQAADGVAALGLALKLDPQVVLLDLAMPRLTGLEVVERLAAERPGMAIVVVTGASDPAIERQAMQAGALRMLSKRASAADLRDAVRAASRQAQGAAETGR